MSNRKSSIGHAMNKGLIFDIQRFSLNDGPGIRTTVFFKGCGLRCRWCHNPESIASYVQLSYDPERCDGCEKCIEFVHGNGIQLIENKAVVDFSIHDRNLDLIEVCPRKAFGRYGDVIDVEKLVFELLKDKDYYATSNGGVTFSGGEALNQWAFIEECARRLKAEGIHLTLDVSGNDPGELIASTTELIDLYLVDYKLSEDELYEKYLGRKYDPLAMLKKLNEANKPVVLRCVLIPGINDSDLHFNGIATIMDQFKNIVQVDLLPYHKLRKRQQFHLVNEREFYDTPDEAMKLLWINKVKDLGILNVTMENQRK